MIPIKISPMVKEDPMEEHVHLCGPKHERQCVAVVQPIHPEPCDDEEELAGTCQTLYEASLGNPLQGVPAVEEKNLVLTVLCHRASLLLRDPFHLWEQS